MGRRVAAVAIALVVALVGAVAVVGYARAADSRAVAGQQTVDVYLSTAKVPAGTTAQEAVNRKLIVLKPVVAKGVPAGALTTIDPQTAGLVASSAIMPGEVVLASRFARAGTKDTKPKASNGVPQGMVAITATLADPQRVAPFLTPGSHIVIYDSFNPRDAKATLPLPDGGKLQDAVSGVRVTRVLLDDVVVIGVGSAKAAAGTTPTPAPSGDTNAPDAANSALVTVALPPKQAITLVHAIQTGTLYAGLLGPSTKVDRNAVVTDNTVLSK